MSSEENRRDASPGEPESDRLAGDAADPGDASVAPEDSPQTPGDSPASTPVLRPDPAAVPYVHSNDVQGVYEDPYGYDPYAPPDDPEPLTTQVTPPVPPPPPVAPPPVSKPADPLDPEEEDEDDDGMLRMSFLEHLEELRKRLLWALVGIAVAFAISLTFADSLWRVVQEPASQALKDAGFKDSRLVFTRATDAFQIIWVKLPLLTSVFIASPWLLYQVWAFVAPGLYKKERRFAIPFILFSAGLFILGGLFAYFIAFRFGLTFLIGFGRSSDLAAMLTITEYFDIFVNVILGVALVFEMPILIFFLTLLRIASPRFLLSHSRYAVLGIVVLAAIITPTPDIVNLMVFSVPMVLLYFVGIFASYLLVLSRENKRFPWMKFLLAVLIPLVLIAAGLYVAVSRGVLQVSPQWPFLTR